MRHHHHELIILAVLSTSAMPDGWGRVLPLANTGSTDALLKQYARSTLTKSEERRASAAGRTLTFRISLSGLYRNHSRPFISCIRRRTSPMALAIALESTRPVTLVAPAEI
ncbi:hypothetical protein BDY17DRAFT_301910, partial [Neohortaea acidophila]